MADTSSPPPSIASFSQILSIKNIDFFPSTRLKTGWYVKCHRFSDRRELHYPALFEDAPDLVKIALLHWADLPMVGRRKSSPEVKQQKRYLEKNLRHYLEAFSSQRNVRKKTAFVNADTLGVRYNLKEVFHSVNSHYFNNTLDAQVRWGSHSSKTSYQQTFSDANGTEWHAITIAGIYNHLTVPRYAIEAIMYHEMLHIHIPPRKNNGRRVVHGTDFRSREKEFSYYAEWRLWEKECVPKILASLRRSVKNRKKYANKGNAKS